MFIFPFAVIISSSMRIKGLLLTAIRENGRLDYDPIGAFPVDNKNWLNPNHLKTSVCVNSVSQRWVHM